MNWEQLKTILWLRWRLMRNQWAKHQNIGAILTIAVLVFVCFLAAASFTVGIVLGSVTFAQATALKIWVAWLVLTLAFLFLWATGLLAELQRSEAIDLQRLMHLPVRLGQLFVINYIVSHAALGVVALVPAMVGLAIGLTISHGPAMLLMLPLALGMVFSVTAWTYCLRGWLATLMSNPRKRRSVMMLFTFAFILIAQGPNFYFNVISRAGREPLSSDPAERAKQVEARSARGKKQFEMFKAAQAYVPPLWVPLGAENLMEGNVLPALCGAAGGILLGAWGLRRAYSGTLKYYRGESDERAADKRAVPQSAVAKPMSANATAGASVSTTTGPAEKTDVGMLEWRPPLLPEPAAALGLATLRSMLRAPEVKMAWGSSLMGAVIVAFSLLYRGRVHPTEGAKPFIATGAMVFAIFMLVQFFANQFGFDRDGFRAYVLSPVNRKWILLGKNLACILVGVVFGMILLAILAFGVSLPPLVMIAALFQLLALLALAMMGGNLLSVLLPYKIQASSMKPSKMPGLSMFFLVICQMLFPLTMIPAFVPPLVALFWNRAGWPMAGGINILLSALMAGGMALGYWYSLGPMGRLLHRREGKILNTVTAEVE